MSTDNKQSLPALTLAAIGVVYCDIGTSPLYTLRECLSGQFGFGVERDAVFGFLSLIFWLLIFTVSIKYITFVMRADNAGEGGILTLMSLAGRNTSARMTSVLVILGLIGGSFFYGEGTRSPLADQRLFWSSILWRSEDDKVRQGMTASVPRPDSPGL